MDEVVRSVDASAAHVEITHQLATIAQHQFQAAEIFEIDVAYRQDFTFHRRSSRIAGKRSSERAASSGARKERGTVEQPARRQRARGSNSLTDTRVPCALSPEHRRAKRW